ncbi:MAG: hypothetical protein JXB26_13370 [Candidatus Aminicenantes bacterium]|nr:hypothetical protein [Candidatus Aminicenantes bacterium]
MEQNRREEPQNIFRKGLRYLGTFLGVGGFCFCLTCFYMAMRGVMDLGGFVASGGPYEIAHPAPGWIWVFFAAVFAGLFFLLVNHLNARKVGGLNLLVLAWPALFLSLGENFLEYSFTFPGSEPGIVWGWFICGAVFILMGGLPLIFIVANFIKVLKRKADPLYTGFLPWKMKISPPGLQKEDRKLHIPFILLILNLAFVGFGIYGGVIFFEFIAK